MKKILITGANSFVGTSVEKWLQKTPNMYSVDTVDMRGDEWRTTDFSLYDTVFHVAGIAHITANPKMEALYYQINRDLPIEAARKAKSSGVKQFIFMSSGIVYGDSLRFGKPNVITESSVPNPKNFYGKSKLQAEKGIMSLANNSFKVVVIRAPMVYGAGCKGNYNLLSKFGRKWKIFPKISNQRSMIYIDNLCEFIKQIIINQSEGVYHPQNPDFVSTSMMVELIAKANNRVILMTGIFNPIIWLLSFFLPVINKAFGNFSYSKTLSEYEDNYQVFSIEESIKITELGVQAPK